MIDHVGHSFIYLQDAVDNNKTITVKLLSDAKAGLKAVDESMQQTQMMAQRVETRAQAASTEVRAITRRYMAALEERELDLLDRIEKIRHVKGNALHYQIEELKHGYTALSKTVHDVEHTLKKGSDVEVLKTKEKLVSKTTQKRFCLRFWSSQNLQKTSE